MNVNQEVMEKVSEALKNQEVVEKLNQATSKEELYAIAGEYIQGVSEEEFLQALNDLKEAGGSIELTESELDSVAGGSAADAGKYTVGTYQTIDLQ